jgi:Zn-dependent peptidase ImmA (M78 family)
MARTTHVPITPEVLTWAIRESGYGAEDIAKRLEVETATLNAWLSGGQKPKLTEFRELTTLLKRPEATFFLPAPPPSSLPSVEFRHPIEDNRRSLNPIELRWLREANRLQRAAAWVQQELGEQPPALPRWALQASAEKAAAALRNDLGIEVEQQLAWSNVSQAQRAWRQAIEGSGVFVFLLPLGSKSCRGFSLWDERAPLITVNTAWNQEARIFTLLHEYGHLITRSSSACVEPWRQTLGTQGNPAERWCEQFAAAVLMPWSDVEVVLTQESGWRPGRRVESLSVVQKVARKFKTSVRATTLRLITHEVAGWDLYRQIPATVDRKPEGGASKGRDRREMREDQYGHRTTELFIEAMRRDVLTRDDVLSYLDVPDTDLP